MEGAYETVGKAGEGFLDAVSGAASAAYDFLKDRADLVTPTTNNGPSPAIMRGGAFAIQGLYTKCIPNFR